MDKECLLVKVVDQYCEESMGDRPFLSIRESRWAHVSFPIYKLHVCFVKLIYIDKLVWWHFYKLILKLIFKTLDMHLWLYVSMNLLVSAQ